jgi:gluconolactonase
VTSELRVTASGLDHPEAVAWYDNYLWCGTESGALIQIDPGDGKAEVIAETGGFLGGLAFDASGNCYCCDFTGRVLIVEQDGSVNVFVDGVNGEKLNTPNFPAFTSDGAFWFTDSGSGWAADDGSLFVVRPDRDPELASDEVRMFPNGLAFSADEARLYVVESRLPGVRVFGLVDGQLGPQDRELVLPDDVPDGVALDSSGALYIGCWRPDRVYRWTEDGKLEIFLDDPTAEYLNSPTNLCFGGPTLTRLYLASLGGWTVTEIDVDIPGVPISLPVPV